MTIKLWVPCRKGKFIHLLRDCEVLSNDSAGWSKAFLAKGHPCFLTNGSDDRKSICVHVKRIPFISNNVKEQTTCYLKTCCVSSNVKQRRGKLKRYSSVVRVC